jgi:hypothetical protein
MAVQELTQELVQHTTIDDAIEHAWEKVFAGEYPNVNEACRELWLTFNFGSVEIDMLALEGLKVLAEDRQREKRQRPTGKPAIGYGAPHGKSWDTYIALTWPYESADGSQRALLDFTQEDWAAFSTRWRKLGDHAYQRASLGTKIGGLLKEHKVTVTNKLPKLILKQIETEAAEVLGRQE